MKVGDTPQAQRAKVVAHEGHGPTESLQGSLALGIVTDDRGVDHGMAQVGSRLHAGDGHETDPWIMHLALDDGADLFLQEMVDAPGALAHVLPRDGPGDGLRRDTPR